MNTVYSQTNVVKFINIQDYVINIDKLKWITVEFTVDKKVKVASKDVIAVFPEEECNFGDSINFRHVTAYEYMMGPHVVKDDCRYKVDISLKGASGLEVLKKYRFVYINDIKELLGLSKPFKIIPLIQKMMKTSSLSNLSQFNNNEGDVAEDPKLTTVNEEGSKYWLKQIPSNAEKELINKTNENHGMLEVELPDQSRRNNRNNRKYRHQHNVQDLNNQVKRLAMQSQRQSPVTPQPPTVSGCSNCHRVGQLLRTQSELYMEIKNLAQKNDDLENEIVKLKNQVELGQAAYQKLSVVHMNERLQFQSAACQPIICVYYQILEGFDSFQRPIYSVHPVLQRAPLNSHQLAQVMMQEAQRQTLQRRSPASDKHTLEEKSKLNPLKFKAIIGNQEEKIRSLTQQLAELQKNQGSKMKVTAVVKEIPLTKKQLIDQNTNISGGDAIGA